MTLITGFDYFEWGSLCHHNVIFCINIPSLLMFFVQGFQTGSSNVCAHHLLAELALHLFHPLCSHLPSWPRSVHVCSPQNIASDTEPLENADQLPEGCKAQRFHVKSVQMSHHTMWGQESTVQKLDSV